MYIEQFLILLDAKAEILKWLCNTCQVPMRATELPDAIKFECRLCMQEATIKVSFASHDCATWPEDVEPSYVILGDLYHLSELEDSSVLAPSYSLSLVSS